MSRIKGKPLGGSNTRPGEAEVVARIWRELEVLRAAFYKGCVLSLGKYISQQTIACRWCVLVTQACLTLGYIMDYSPSASSVSRILRARTLQWVAIPFSRDLRDPGIKPGSPSLQADSLLSEPPEKPTSRLWPEWKVYLPLHPTFWLPIGDSPGRTQRKARKHGYWFVQFTKVGIYGPREECRMYRNECKGENKEYPIPVIKALF